MTMTQQEKTIRLRTAPNWLPEQYRTRTERLRFRFKVSAPEIRQFRRRKPLLPSEWAPKYRTVTYGPLQGSRWNNDFMPHMRGVMDAAFFPSVRQIGNCKAPQTGSSAGAETALAYTAERKPGDTLVIYPDRETSKERSTDYLQPIFTRSKRLQPLLTGLADDLAGLRIKLQTQLIYMGWAGSVTSLGNKSVKYLYCDEIDKWPDKASKKEANTRLLAMERVRAYKHTHKIFFTSTPTAPDGPIWVYMTKEAQAVFDYHARCPDCDSLQAMTVKNVRYSHLSEDPDEIEAKRLAVYVCAHCGTEWNDRKRDLAVRAGQWHARGDGRELFTYLRAERPEKICFHSPSLISPLVSLSEFAAAYIRGHKDPGKMHYFQNQHAAEPFTDYGTIRDTDAIMALRDDRPAGLVPSGGVVAALIAGADTQDNGFYYTIRAVGWGLAQESWQIRHGFAPTLAELEKAVFDTHYQDAAGLYYPVHLMVIDSQGHRTKEVYDFCRLHPGRAQAYNGASGRRANPISFSTRDRYPGTTTQIPGGLKLATCDSHHFKDLLSDKLRILPDDPGAFHLHAGTTLEYAMHMVAEYRDARNMWQCPSGKPNHYWDCEMMALIAAEILQIRYWHKEAA